MMTAILTLAPCARGAHAVSAGSTVGREMVAASRLETRGLRRACQPHQNPLDLFCNARIGCRPSPGMRAILVSVLLASSIAHADSVLVMAEPGSANELDAAMRVVLA